jgi:aryl-alcohol dehydrogenase-like predicted oxidoreductase
MTATQLGTAQPGETGPELSRVGLGAWAIGGGGWEFGGGPQGDHQSIAAIHRALDLGVNWIDTAAAYDFGRSEQIVRRALERVAPVEPLQPQYSAASLELTDEDLAEIEGVSL